MKAIQRFDFYKTFLFGVPLLFIWFMVLLFAGGSLNLAVIFTACSIPPYFIVCFLSRETLGLTTYDPLNFEVIVKYILLTIYLIAFLVTYYLCTMYPDKYELWYVGIVLATGRLIGLFIDKWIFKKQSNHPIKRTEQAGVVLEKFGDSRLIKNKKFDKGLEPNEKERKSASMLVWAGISALFVIVFIAFGLDLLHALEKKGYEISIVPLILLLIVAPLTVFALYLVKRSKIKRGSNRAIKQKTTQNIQKAPPNNENSCPNCGSSLSIRKSTKGKSTGQSFRVCSNYPTCKTVMELQIS